MDLLKLNRRFYLKTQQYFNRSRQSPWPGWQKLLPYLQGQTLKVLDLGCGNGRFGIWLASHYSIDYVGLDENQYLLDRAAATLPRARLIRHNLTKPWLIKDKFDL
ncbi:MAG: class I SAM-dependent methyltransferase, partial [Patescibacteria group bacterium]|nr:class I SAM-dependent methyltransferase [Patescibacteria group bacterium]